MHRFGIGLAVLAWVIFGSLGLARAQASKPGWESTLDSEFRGTALDPSEWQKRYKWGEGQVNGELQAYVDDAFTLDGEVLEILGQHAPGEYAGQTFDYRSGLIASVSHQRYGWFEIRCRMPLGKGLWPAFWLLGENGTEGVNEIDVFEFLGDDPTTVHMGVHWGESYSVGHESDGQTVTGPDFSAEYHTFAVDWDPNRVVWYVDGEERFRHEGAGVPQVEMYVIANLAIGGSWPGAPDASTTFPASYAIDYIRVYRTASTQEDAGAPPPAADASLEEDAGIPVSDADTGALQGNLDSRASDGCGCRWVSRSPDGSRSPLLAWLGLVAGACARRRRCPSRPTRRSVASARAQAVPVGISRIR